MVIRRSVLEGGGRVVGSAGLVDVMIVGMM